MNDYQRETLAVGLIIMAIIGSIWHAYQFIRAYLAHRKYKEV